ncbi:unnamed protein product, partial [Timema podura]|nr:unnamed protein product [Timema podura]
MDEKPSTETLEGIYDEIQYYRPPPFEPTLQEFKSDPDMDHCFCDLPKDRILSQNNHYLWNIHQNDARFPGQLRREEKRMIGIT